MGTPSMAEAAGRSTLRRYGEYLGRFQRGLAGLSLGPSSDSAEAWAPAVWTEAGLGLELDGLREPTSGWASGNELVDKALLALTALSTEAERLRRELAERFLPALLVYGEACEDLPLVQLGRMLPCLAEVAQWVLRGHALVRNLVSQLSALAQPRREAVFAVDGRPSPEPVWRCLAQVLGSLVTLDEALEQRPLLREHWTTYLKTVQLVQLNPAKFNLETKDLRPLERQVLGHIDTVLFTTPSAAFRNVADQTFVVSPTTSLAEDCPTALLSLLQQWERRLDGGRSVQAQLVDLTALVGFVHALLAPQREKKATKTLWELLKKCPLVPVAGDLLFCPAKWLKSNVAHLGDVLDKKAVTAGLGAGAPWALGKAQLMQREADGVAGTVGGWAASLSASLRGWSADVNADLERRATLFVQGMRLGQRLGSTAALVLGHHLHSGTPIPKRSALAVFRLLHCVAEIQAALEKNWLLLVDSLGHALSKWSAALLRLVLLAKNSLKPGKNLDALSSLVVAEKILSGPTTFAHLAALKHALHLANVAKVLKSEELAMLWATLERYEEVFQHLRRPRLFALDFVLFHRALVPLLCQTSLGEAGWAAVLASQLRLLADASDLFRLSRHVPPETARDAFAKELSETLATELVERLCSLVEVDLRLSTHGHLQLDDRNPLKGREGGAVDLRPLLRLAPLRLPSGSLCLRTAVQAHLRRTFYNLTSVSLADWASYAEMCAVGREKLGLELAAPALPAHTLHSGLDLLEIMRNLPVFVSKYLYNLNTQSFIERSSKNRHLNSLSLDHVTASIRAHGAGVMNTTVNYTYQFLRRKFHVFSQFLYDDQIKSRLLKDARFFREHREALDGRYPVERAEKFNRGIRKLGSAPDGSSFLDQFRRLITEIGNALGYVRLIRSGGAQLRAEAAELLPDEEEIVALAPLAPEDFADETRAALTQLDDLTQAILTASDTDYFKLLVEVFTSQMREGSQTHLRTFPLICPPLMVNFLDHSLAAKERLGKRGAEGEAGAFTDDGFPMGLAYILRFRSPVSPFQWAWVRRAVLRLLDAYGDFDALHFVESVEESLRAEAEAAAKEAAGAKGGAKLSQTAALGAQRRALYKRELRSLSYNLRSARIFFRTDLSEGLGPRAQKGDDARSIASSHASDATQNQPSIH